ncbi:conserved membrane hypothetical protein [Candidatus Sulfopaludibacter sp. SbA3]|nr:conserved membrane hypothetical protein [Candidatus Sulfopaludibacter sp. SbA3]
MTPIGPITPEERINSLDTLRGFALLGILPANVLVFGMHLAAGSDPTVAGGAAGLNLVSWALYRILIVGKMRCLFSMVFGASMILLTSRAEERSGTTAADIYYRRDLWLLLFGLAHAFLLFWGDILYPYALCALILFPFRKLPAKKLLIIGGLFIAFKAGWSAVDAFHQLERRDLAAAAAAAGKVGKKPAEVQAEAAKELEAQRKQRKPSSAELEKDARTWRGNPWEVIGARAKALAVWHGLPYYDPANCDIWSMMFIGMGLFKLGVFSAARSFRLYTWIAVIGCLIGIPLNSYTAWLAVKSNFDRVTFAFTHVAYDIERLPIALACMALLMILCKAGALRWLTSRLAAIGQMALSNYIMQSLVCTFVFTGYGFGLYGRLERYQLYYVVAGCWAMSLAASPVWLRHYRFGPLEWCWRSLTYWKKQPMRIRRPSGAPRAAEAVA